jgi:outer membrane scaffolding protein for murein synthesis (MipA/OmpV family)
MFRQILATSLICISTGAIAEGQWTLGVLGIGTTGTYVGDDDFAGFAPIITYETERLRFGLEGIAYDVFEFEQGHVGVALGYRDGAPFPEKGALFKGLKRDGAVEAGIQSQLEFGNAYVSLDTFTDISDEHDGNEASIALGYAVTAGDFVVGAELGARYRDANLNQFLYGVSAVEATSNRAKYSADETTTAFASMTVAYPITETMSAIGLIQYEGLGDNADSPLVDDDDVFTGGIGIVMSF